MVSLSKAFNPLGSAPGVHFVETAMAGQTAFNTGIPLFIGFAETIRHDDDQRRCGSTAMLHRINDWERFSQCLRPHSGSYLDYAVRGFFDNGGKSCLIVSIAIPGGGGYAMARALEGLFNPIQGGALEDIVGIDLVCVPDIMMKAFRATPGAVSRLQQWALAYCRHMGDRFAILECVPGSNGPSMDTTAAPTDLQRQQMMVQAIAQRQQILNHLGVGDTAGKPVEGALYFPWICVKPLPRHRLKKYVLVPPSGHIAGIYARSDAMYGVHKAPANEVVEGAEDLEIDVSDHLQEALNLRGINCLRSFPGRGIRVWGSRTLSPWPNWRYINVRRLFLTLERWIEVHMQDIVFEPNTPALWDHVRDHLGAFCFQLFNKGALMGTHPGEGFFVKCDAETNPREVREAGRLVCYVGLAPVQPAEFIVLRVTRSNSGATTYEPVAPRTDL